MQAQWRNRESVSGPVDCGTTASGLEPARNKHGHPVTVTLFSCEAVAVKKEANGCFWAASGSGQDEGHG
jgi:hypothetical protein